MAWAPAATRAAMSGIDVVWDAKAKALNLPLYKLLGELGSAGAGYAGGVALGYQEPAALIDEAAPMAAGYTAVKPMASRAKPDGGAGVGRPEDDVEEERGEQRLRAEHGDQAVPPGGSRRSRWRAAYPRSPRSRACHGRWPTAPPYRPRTTGDLGPVGGTSFTRSAWPPRHR